MIPGSHPIASRPIASGADVNASAAGATLTATASLIDGAASGAATAAGSTLTVTASIIEGVATGEANAAGDLLTSTASIIAGEASGEDGQVDGDADGDLLTVAASIIAGVATGSAVEPPRPAPIVTRGMPPGVRHEKIKENAQVYGDIVEARAYLIAGTASGQVITEPTIALAQGGSYSAGDLGLIGETPSEDRWLLPQDTRLVQGAEARGATIGVSVSLIAGTASGSSAPEPQEPAHRSQDERDFELLFAA